MGATSLLINLAFVGKKPTGLATYAINLVPQLNLPNATLLASASFLPRLNLTDNPPAVQPVPANLTYEQGKIGHLRRMLWTQFTLSRLCQQLQADLLFSPLPEAPLSLSCPTVIMVHDVIPLRFPSRTSLLTHYFRYYVPQVLKQAQHILCNSHATAQDIVDYFAIPATQITPIPLAHDSTHFRPPPHPSPLTPPTPPPPYFLYLGRHDPYKNLSRLISAFAALPHREIQLWIAGSHDPRFTPALQSQVAELQLSHRVQFLDYITYDQLPALLSGAIAMVYPSLWEGFGLPVLEAMGCGTPVITSNLSSLPEVAGDAALLVNPYREAEITDAMQQILNDDTLRSQLQAASLARASQFSWRQTAERTREVLLE